MLSGAFQRPTIQVNQAVLFKPYFTDAGANGTRLRTAGAISRHGGACPEWHEVKDCRSDLPPRWGLSPSSDVHYQKCRAATSPSLCMCRTGLRRVPEETLAPILQQAQSSHRRNPSSRACWVMGSPRIRIPIARQKYQASSRPRPEAIPEWLRASLQRSRGLDWADIDIALRRSLDGSRPWLPRQILVDARRATADNSTAILPPGVFAAENGANQDKVAAVPNVRSSRDED